MSSGFEHSQTFSIVDKAYLGKILVIYETFTEYVFQNKFVQLMCDNELFYTCEELFISWDKCLKNLTMISCLLILYWLLTNIFFFLNLPSNIWRVLIFPPFIVDVFSLTEFLSINITFTGHINFGQYCLITIEDKKTNRYYRQQYEI